jgi:hypothetical protein
MGTQRSLCAPAPHPTRLAVDIGASWTSTFSKSPVQKAAITALERLTMPYKKGYVPPGAINWGT